MGPVRLSIASLARGLVGGEWIRLSKLNSAFCF